MSDTRTELESLGEFGLIEHLTNEFELGNLSSIKGIGDDAAVLDTQGKQVVWSTDMLVEGIHFDLSYVPLKHLGYKAVVANISDICAMNAVASQITVSIAVSNRFSLQALEEFYSGIKLACEKYNVDLVGGDTTTSRSGFVISISVIGFADPEKITLRSTAGYNDLMCVTGDLGGAYIGLQVLEREKSVFMATSTVQPDLSGFDYIIERQLKPEARRDIVDLFVALDLRPTAMIDISDGLASEILHLTDQSNAGADIYEDKIPMDPLTIKTALEFGIDPMTCSLNGGEDYELLFTIRQSDFDKIKGNPNITVIGHVTDQKSGCQLITKSGSAVPLKAQGWNSFRS